MLQIGSLDALFQQDLNSLPCFITRSAEGKTAPPDIIINKKTFSRRSRKPTLAPPIHSGTVAHVRNDLCFGVGQRGFFNHSLKFAPKGSQT
jgi:hypothetical protein